VREASSFLLPAFLVKICLLRFGYKTLAIHVGIYHLQKYSCFKLISTKETLLLGNENSVTVGEG